MKCSLDISNYLEEISSLSHSIVFLYFFALFIGGSDSKVSCLQCGRSGFDPWVRKILWRREWQPTLVLLLGKSMEEPGRLQSLGSERVGHDWVTSLPLHFLSVLVIFWNSAFSWIIFPFLHCLWLLFFSQLFVWSEVSCSVVSDSLQPHEL